MRHFRLATLAVISTSNPNRFSRMTNVLEDLALEDLVADLHIREVEVGHHVGKHGEDLVSHVVPEKHHPVRAAAEEARAKDHVRVAVEDRPQQVRILPRIVFEVGVLDQDDVTRGRGEPGPQSRALALVPAVKKEDHFRVFLFGAFENRARAVG